MTKKKQLLDFEKFSFHYGREPAPDDVGNWHFHRVGIGPNYYYGDMPYSAALEKFEADGVAGVGYEVLFSETNPKRVRVVR